MAVGFDPRRPTSWTAGLNREGCRQILDAPWWDEMVADVVETPEMCDPEDPPEQVLQYARDVVVGVHPQAGEPLAGLASRGM